MVNTDVTVLSTGSVGGTGGVDGDGVQGTEVTTYTADLIFEDLVIESSLEFTLAGGGCCDIHSGLTTTKDHKLLLGRDRSGVERGIGGVGLQDGKIAGRQDLSCFVSPL